MITTGGSSDANQNEASITHMDSTEPSTSIDENDSVNLSHTNKIKPICFTMSLEHGALLSPAFLPRILERGPGREQSNVRCSCDNKASDLTKAAYPEYRCRQEEEETNKVEGESFTEFCEKGLKSGGYAVPPAHLFMIDEWNLAFSKRGFTVMSVLTWYVTGFPRNAVQKAVLAR